MAPPDLTANRLPTGGPTAGGDDLDDLLNYDVGLDDVFRDIEPPKATAPTTKKGSSKTRGGAGLGIDEEVEVIKKPRIPRAKLDDNRLLSQAGIPKLRKRAKEHLKFKGKGHEYSDAARLLSFYQLWLDDLFPKAKFLDALAMVEKVGHKKRIQMMRVEWINEGKPRTSVHEESIYDDPVLPGREKDIASGATTRIAPIFELSVAERAKTPANNYDIDDELYDATPRSAPVQAAKSATAPLSGNGSLFGPAKSAYDDIPEDDLDALLAEEEMESANKRLGSKASGTTAVAPPAEDNFDDEMEAMAGMDDMW